MNAILAMIVSMSLAVGVALIVAAVWMLPE